MIVQKTNKINYSFNYMMLWAINRALLLFCVFAKNQQSQQLSMVAQKLFKCLSIQACKDKQSIKNSRTNRNNRAIEYIETT